MQTIDQALKEVQALHEQLTHAPAPEIAPHAFVPFPPGFDPVAYAIGEVSQLRQLLGSALGGATPVPMAAQWVPPASVFANESGVTFLVELPGVERTDLTVSVAGPELIVRGQRKPAAVDPTLRPLLVEHPAGIFERRFPVPAWCQPDRVNARYAQGVLEITVTRPGEEIAGEFSVKIA
jgi:HSP20 family protein